MCNDNTNSTNVKTVNTLAYREIDAIRLKVNELVDLLEIYKKDGRFVDPEHIIIFNLHETDNLLVEASMALERLGAR